MVKGKQKIFVIKHKKVKGIPMLRGYHDISARTPEIAKRKFKRTFLGRQKILGVWEKEKLYK